jgi:hypothetical protein
MTCYQTARERARQQRKLLQCVSLTLSLGTAAAVALLLLHPPPLAFLSGLDEGGSLPRSVSHVSHATTMPVMR